jgi:hypothetical protein
MIVWVAEKITPVLAKTPNTTSKKLKTDLEKGLPNQGELYHSVEGKTNGNKRII